LSSVPSKFPPFSEADRTSSLIGDRRLDTAFSKDIFRTIGTDIDLKVVVTAADMLTNCYPGRTCIQRRPVRTPANHPDTLVRTSRIPTNVFKSESIVENMDITLMQYGPPPERRGDEVPFPLSGKMISCMASCCLTLALRDGDVGVCPSHIVNSIRLANSQPDVPGNQTHPQKGEA
jgi:hypothetical protein